MITETPSPCYPEVLLADLDGSSYGATILEYEHELAFLPWPPGTAVPPNARGLIRKSGQPPVPVLDFRTPSDQPRRYRLLLLMGRRGADAEFSMALLIDAPTTPASPLPSRLVKKRPVSDRN